MVVQKLTISKQLQVNCQVTMFEQVFSSCKVFSHMPKVSVITDCFGDMYQEAVSAFMPRSFSTFSVSMKQKYDGLVREKPHQKELCSL